MCVTFVSRNYFGEVTFPYKCSKVLSGLLKVTFDVNVPERLTRSLSLFRRAPVLRLAGSRGWPAHPGGWQGHGGGGPPRSSRCECGAA